MYQTQLLKIRIRPGKTDRVVEFLRDLADRKDDSLEALRREGMMVESLFLERRDEADYLYYYVKARDLAHANEINLQSSDPLTLAIRDFVSETWGDVASPEPLLDLDLIPDADEDGKPSRPRRKAKMGGARDGSQPIPASGPGSTPPHALAGG
ncbi:MAG TPA: DUF6176 family protein [Fibrobacteria bacterium]|nr:DUF6176 family protein [Fibrobacteria bacterium]